MIFDFDGTLANTIDTGIRIYNEISSDYGLSPLTREEVMELRKLNIRSMLARIGISRLTAIRIARRLRGEIHEQMNEIEMIPGVAEALEALHESGFRMGIVSSNSVSNIREFIARFDLAHCFEFVEGGVSLFGKSRRINRVLRRKRLDSNEVLYIGDETRDLEAAKKSKIGMIAVCWGANEKEAMIAENPDFCIESPSELLGCVDTFRDRLLPGPGGA